MNLRPSGYEPKKNGGFLSTNRGGGQMADRLCKPNTLVETWWTDSLFSCVHHSFKSPAAEIKCDSSKSFAERNWHMRETRLWATLKLKCPAARFSFTP